MVDEIIKLASEWGARQQKYIQEAGFPLTSRQIAIASQVGVQLPESIRILEVDKIPAPTDALLQQVAAEMNFLSPNTIGITLGYGVYLRTGFVTDRLLSHEFRHVHQYEISGSIQNFIAEYLQQIFRFGYRDAPHEADARDHEII